MNTFDIAIKIIVSGLCYDDWCVVVSLNWTPPPPSPLELLELPGGIGGFPLPHYVLSSVAL